MDFRQGMNIPQSTLYVEIEEIGKKYICKCSVCRQSERYSESELREDYPRCKICEQIRTDRNLGRLIKGDYDKAERMINNYIHGKARSGSDGVYPIGPNDELYGQSFGDLNVIYKIVKYNRDKFSDVMSCSVGVGDSRRYLLRCPACNYTTIKTIGDIKKESSSLKCPNCSKFTQQSSTIIKSAMERKRLHSIKIENNRKEKEIASGKDIFVKMKSPLDNVKSGSNVDKYIKKVKEANLNLDIQGLIPAGATYVAHCMCMECGSEVIIPSSAKNKKVDCPGCEKKKTNLNYRGLYQRDLSNTCKNNLIISNHRGTLCDATCKFCKRVQKDVKLFDVMNDRIYCACSGNDREDIDICLSCGSTMKITMKSIMSCKDNEEEIICSKCGKPSGITYQNIKNQIVADDRRFTIAKKLDISVRDIKNSTVTFNDIIKEKEPVYIGTDGMPYYKCRCLKHSTDLTLNDNEIANFDCNTYCDDGRQHLIDRPDPDKINL